MKCLRTSGIFYVASFITTNIHLFYKSTKESDWDSVEMKKKKSAMKTYHLLSLDSSVPVKYLINGKYNAAVVLALSDNSYLGILLGSKLDGGGLNDFDKITLQVLLQIFSSAHKSFINQKKEKKLISS